MVWFYLWWFNRIEKLSFPLSIPLWSDFIANYRLQQYAIACALSIPLWSDFICIHAFFSRRNKLLSIPLWSDFIVVLGMVITCVVVSAFNPTMVWFYRERWDFMKDSSTSLSIPLWSDFILFSLQPCYHLYSTFQSHYGLILSIRKRIAPLSKSKTFNPTMVWFYRVNDDTVHHRSFLLSIPLWSDFISQPTWHRELGLFTLSIPLWSDFISSPNEPPPIGNHSFQSHYGLILSTVKLFWIRF